MTKTMELNGLKIQDILAPYNPWWQTGEVKTEVFKRPIFHRIYQDLFDLKQIISITGPRRVGKTTILKQIIQSLIQEKKSVPQQIVYFSFDDPLLSAAQVRERFFEQLIEWADKNRGEKAVYFFLDEIQRFEKWELYLKKFYDLGFPGRFVISGSASSPIFRKSRESLLGRIKDNHLLPFSFKEFVYFHKPDDSELLQCVNSLDEFGQKMQFTLSVNWHNLLATCKPVQIFERINNDLKSLLDQYVIEGGFPETWEIKDFAQKQQYLFDNQIQKVIFEDLVIATEFRKPEKIKSFYLSLIEQPGQEISIEKTSQKIGVSRQMLEKYLPLLEMTDLVKTIPRFSRRPLKFRRGSVKCYLVDLALRNAILKLNVSALSDPNLMGSYAENLVFNALSNFRGAIELSFYKDARREIDFIVSLGGKKFLPVEVKYRGSPDEIKGLEYFLTEYKQQPGIVVTKDILKVRDPQILFVPLEIFLLFF